MVWRLDANPSVATVRWTVARHRLDGDDTLIKSSPVVFVIRFFHVPTTIFRIVFDIFPNLIIILLIPDHMVVVGSLKNGFYDFFCCQRFNRPYNGCNLNFRADVGIVPYDLTKDFSVLGAYGDKTGTISTIVIFRNPVCFALLKLRMLPGSFCMGQNSRAVFPFLFRQMQISFTGSSSENIIRGSFIEIGEFYQNVGRDIIFACFVLEYPVWDMPNISAACFCVRSLSSRRLRILLYITILNDLGWNILRKPVEMPRCIDPLDRIVGQNCTDIPAYA